MNVFTDKKQEGSRTVQILHQQKETHARTAIIHFYSKHIGNMKYCVTDVKCFGTRKNDNNCVNEKGSFKMVAYILYMVIFLV